MSKIFAMLGIIFAVTVLVLSYGSLITFGQLAAPYSSCIKFTDGGYNITLQQDDHCSAKQLSETIFYYRANGYHQIGNSSSNIVQLIR
jgi:hypothetical protein